MILKIFLLFSKYIINIFRRTYKSIRIIESIFAILFFCLILKKSIYLLKIYNNYFDYINSISVLIGIFAIVISKIDFSIIKKV